VTHHGDKEAGPLAADVAVLHVLADRLRILPAI
jgi:hypothetical protein